MQTQTHTHTSACRRNAHTGVYFIALHCHTYVEEKAKKKKKKENPPKSPHQDLDCDKTCAQIRWNLSGNNNMTVGSEEPNIKCHIYFQPWLRAVWQTTPCCFSISQPIYWKCGKLGHISLQENKKWSETKVKVKGENIKLSQSLSITFNAHTINNIPLLRHSNSSQRNGAFMEDHTLTSARQTPTSLDRRGPACINNGARGRWIKGLLEML